MTFAAVIDDLIICGVFLFIGYFLREAIPFFRNLYLPASVIGGVLCLLLGPQVLGLIEVPASFSSYATPITNIVFTALVWGVTINGKKLKSYLDYTLIEFGVTNVQVFLGATVGILCLKIWNDMPSGWGLMAPFSFLSGHGTAASMAAVFSSYGIEGTGDIGMVLSTVGLMSAMLIGTIFVNLGVRKGYAQFVKPGDTIKKQRAGALPEDEQVPIGKTKVSNAAINNLLFQFAIILTVLWFGNTVMKYLAIVFPILGKISAMINGIVGCLILWPITCKLKLDVFVDKKTVDSIGGMCIDVLIVGAVSTLNLAFVSQYWLPLLIISLVCVGSTAVYTFFLCRKCCEVEWFEKFIFIYGMATGVVATGFALHRMVDPECKSIVPEVQGVCSGVTSPITFPMYTLLISLSVAHSGLESLFGLALAGICTISVWVLFRKKVKVLNR